MSVLFLLNLKVDVGFPQDLQQHRGQLGLLHPALLEGASSRAALTSGMSSRGCPMASSKMARARSTSPRMVSSSANLIQVVQFSGLNSRYFS